MYNFFNSVRQYVWLNGLLYLIFGLFFLFDPRQTLSAFIWLFAAFFVIFGIINLIASLRVHSQTGIYDVGLSIGIFQLILAVLILVFAKPLLAFIPIITGVTLIILGISEIIDAFSRRQFINVVPLPMIIYGIILILIGIVLTFNPFTTVLVLLQFFGAILIVNAIMDFIGMWRWK
ncbi:hypothetical protein HMPREF9103_01742 [Lentilactobacillus parafarraginis F0439]|uniref:Acid-resistance membrane protein n=1 Tax=Lentilactobacillus parafarraginis F0439 TaxID=797515 RepID=G9ZPT7_9LACO|nr:DUF308 domain-containing protein [Lentilactobacillus parafarraginis]EHL98000.1 hypothetical protein HMPREF9103_01742 [Lentilactobacillus parafarraginis F0439]